jgi:hypothetical protein
MTRRGFIESLMKAGAAAIVGMGWFFKETLPRKSVWANGLKKYPGRIKSMVKVFRQGKWSG